MSNSAVVSQLATGSPPARLYFIDHLRVALTILVVLHHLAVIYGASAPFYYVEPPAQTDGVAYVVLLFFVLLNQGYFMGFFFLLSGYLTPGSFERKGPARFLKDRLLRLGIPLVAFMLLLNPLASLGIYQMPASLTGITTPLTWQMYPDLIGQGPLWFIEMLLIFDFGYAAWRMLRKNHNPTPESSAVLPGYRAIVAFTLGLALTSYVIRIVLPLGKTVLSFPSLAYLPQYLSFFILGVLANRHDWLGAIPKPMGRVGFIAAAAATILLLPIALTGGADFVGNGSWQSAVYVLWDSIFSVGMCLGLITLFRRLFDRSNSFSRFLSRHAFTVYIIHAPLIVLLALALRGIQTEHLLKFGLAALLGLPLCFAIAYLVRKIPLASRIL